MRIGSNQAVVNGGDPGGLKNGTNFQVSTGRGPARARAAPGLGRAWAGPAAAWYFLFILDIFRYFWIYIFGYIFGIFLVYFSMKHLTIRDKAEDQQHSPNTRNA